MERGLRADLADEIDLLRVDKVLVLILVILVSNGDSGQAGTLFSQIGDYGPGVDTSDGWNTFSGTPFTQAFHSGPVGIFLRDIRNHHSHSLDIGALKVF